MGESKRSIKKQRQSGMINLWSLLASWNNIFSFSLFQELCLVV